jgi:phage tail-like protein
MPDLPRLDPLPAFNFYVGLIEEGDASAALAAGLAAFVLGGFSECSGLESELQVEEYQEGGVNDRVHRFPSRFAYSNIVLKRGVGFGEDLWLWHEGFLDHGGARRSGFVVLANELRAPIKVWSFERGLPVKWTGPSLNAGTSAVAIETLEIAHEKLGLVMSPGKALDAAADAVF